MDEVWILSLCLTIFGFFIFILTLKPKKQEVPESIIKSFGAPAPVCASSDGKSLEVREDEVEKMMERLNKLLSDCEPKKKEVYQERKKVALEKEEEDFPHRREDTESTNETQELTGKVPGHTQPAYQTSHHRVQERSAPAAVENIMDEIEQAVQETGEPDYYTRRRQERAAARAKPWTETEGM